MKNKYKQVDKKYKKAVRKIEELLDIPEIPPPTNREELIEANKLLMHNFLQKIKATTVVVQYDGSGDSGEITEVNIFKGKTKIEAPKETVEIFTGHSEYDPTSQKYNFRVDKREGSINEVLETFAEEILEQAGIDWVNNSGGYGEVEYYVKKNKAKLKHNQRVEDTEYEEHEF